MSDKIWFFTKKDMLIDLNQADFFSINESYENYHVVMHVRSKEGNDWQSLGSFEKKDDALDYLVRIKNILDGD